MMNTGNRFVTFTVLKTSAFILAVCLLAALCLVPAEKAWGKVVIEEVTGTITSANPGMDSGTMTAKTARGVMTFVLTPTDDHIPAAEKQTYYNKVNTLGGFREVSMLDVGHRATIWYVPGTGSKHMLVKYKVTDTYSDQWIAIIASVKERRDAQVMMSKAKAAGFKAETLVSNNFENFLMPGYFVVFIGCSSDKAQVQKLVDKARQKGWHDAYVKQVR